MVRTERNARADRLKVVGLFCKLNEKVIDSDGGNEHRSIGHSYS